MPSLLESARKVARKDVPNTELNEDYPGKGKNKQDSPPAQGSSQKAKVEPLYKGSGAGKGVKSAAPLAPKAKEFQAAPPKQGSSQDAPIVDVDSSEVGKKVSEKMKKDTTLPKGNGAGKAPNFKTKGDPTKVVGAKTSDGNVFQAPASTKPTRRVAEETEEETEEEMVQMTDEEFDALTPEQQAELTLIVDEDAELETEETAEELEEKLKADKGKAEKKEEENDKAFEAKRKAHKEELQLDVKTLFASETELSEEFKEKTASLFEAAVTARVAIEMEALTEKLADESVAVIEEYKTELKEQMDAYLTETAAEWIAVNEVALEDSLRTELTEEFMVGLKKLFAESYIEVPTDKYDVLTGLQEELDEAKATIAERDEEANALAEELLAMRKSAVIAVVTEGLAETEVEKFEKIIENVEYEDDDSYSEKLNMIKENAFHKKGTKLVESDLVEGEDEPVKEEPTGRMGKYVKTLSTMAKNRG